MRIGLFIPCFIDAFFPEVGIATLETEVITATRVGEFVFDQDLAQVERPRDMRGWIERRLYKPAYGA